MKPVYLSILQKETGTRIKTLLKEKGNTVKDIQEAVIDAHRATVYNQLQNFVEWRYLERVSGSHYKATQYAKDIMNVERELKA